MNQSRLMKVCSEVELTAPVGTKHLSEMKAAAERITDDKSSVRTWVDKERPKSVFAECTIPKARQMDVVDRIMHEFALYMEDYSTQSLWFPHPPKKRGPRRKPRPGVYSPSQPSPGNLAQADRQRSASVKAKSTTRPSIRYNDAWEYIPLDCADDFIAFLDRLLQPTHPLRSFKLFPVAKCWRKEKYLIEEEKPSELLWVLDMEKKKRIRGKTCFYFKQLETQEELDAMMQSDYEAWVQYMKDAGAWHE